MDQLGSRDDETIPADERDVDSSGASEADLKTSSEPICADSKSSLGEASVIPVPGKVRC